MGTKNHGITLVALIITIIIMLILAGIVISLTIGENGIMKKAEESGIAYSEQEAREKLALVLLDMQADKVTNKAYNQDQYLTNKIEEKNMIVNGDIVFVDGWQFQIDRSIPKIVANLGKGEANQQIKLAVSQTVSSDYVKSMVKIEIEYEAEITYIQFGGEEIEVPEKKDGKYLLEKEVRVNGNYSVFVKDKEDKYQMATIKVSEITEDMDIWTKEDMELFRDLVNSGRTYEGRTVKLMKDIDLEGSIENIWNAIGNDINRFKGEFEGNNHKITNLYIDIISKDGEAYGLFGRTIGNIRNLILENGTIKIENIGESSSPIGAIAGNSLGKVTNCTNKVNINLIGKGNIGGIVGASGAIIENCQNYGTVTSRNNKEHVGGIIGYQNGNANVTNCKNFGKIEVTQAEGYIGGISGFSEGNISKCINKGGVSYINPKQYYKASGGISGYLRNNKTIDNCINYAQIQTLQAQDGRAGGIVGSSTNCTISNSYNKGNIKAEGSWADAGGILGHQDASTKIQNCYNIGSLIGVRVGGISAYQGTVINCYSTVSINSSYLMTLSQMKQSNFVDKLGDAYSMDISIQNEGLPILKWQLEE